MSKPKLTPWFSAHTQYPERVGWYDFNDGARVVRHYWTGERWVLGAQVRIMVPTFSTDRWRGILRDGGEG